MEEIARYQASSVVVIMASAPSVQEEPLQPEPEPGTEHFRSQLAAAVRSIRWSYAIFWSISTSHSR
ncbi:hypothetical protein ABZP36_015574 [Zizania latifolia]